MSKLKEWWAVILLTAVVFNISIYAMRYTQPFRINVTGGLFDAHYQVEIPQRYMTNEMADKHNEAFLSSINDLVKK